MKRIVLSAVVAAVVGWFVIPAAQAQSFADVAGVWSLKKSHAWGETTQTVEFKDNRFSYQETNSSGDTLLVARGDVKVEKLGPFKVLHLTKIEGGTSESWLEPVNEDRSLLYVKGWNTLTVALNFDAYHDGEDARVDVYKKSN